jgi:hypothetical protein
VQSIGSAVVDAIFGAFGAAGDGATVARWSVNPLGMLAVVIASG